MRLFRSEKVRFTWSDRKDLKSPCDQTRAGEPSIVQAFEDKQDERMLLVSNRQRADAHVHFRPLLAGTQFHPGALPGDAAAFGGGADGISHNAVGAHRRASTAVRRFG